MTVEAHDFAAPIAPKTELRPYVWDDGTPSFTDSEIVALFEQAKSERLLPLILYNCNPDMTAGGFLSIYKGSDDRLMCLIFHDEKLAGWVWLDDFQNRTARIHFCLFRWVSKAKASVSVGREMFRQLLSARFNGVTLKLIRAEMPSFNKPGVWFLEKVGLQAVGEIPNAALEAHTRRVYQSRCRSLHPWCRPQARARAQALLVL